MRADRGSSAFGRTKARRNGRGGEGRREASQLECNDDGDSVGNPTSEGAVGKFESTSGAVR